MMKYSDMKYIYTYEVRSKIVIIALVMLLCVMFAPMVAWFLSCCVVILLPIAFCLGIWRMYDIWFT